MFQRVKKIGEGASMTVGGYTAIAKASIIAINVAKAMKVLGFNGVIIEQATLFVTLTSLIVSCIGIVFIITALLDCLLELSRNKQH